MQRTHAVGEKLERAIVSMMMMLMMMSTMQMLRTELIVVTETEKRERFVVDEDDDDMENATRNISHTEHAHGTACTKAPRGRTKKKTVEMCFSVISITAMTTMAMTTSKIGVSTAGAAYLRSLVEMTN